MKRIYAICLFLTLLLGIGFRAGASDPALSVTVTWDTPGSIRTAEIGTMSFQKTEIDTDITSRTFTLNETWGYLKLYPASGYRITGAEADDGTSISPFSNGTGININLSVYNGKTVHVNCEKIERDKTFDIDIVNGTNVISAQFASGYTLDLKEGKNSYSFNPDIDNPLTVKISGVDEPYIITIDDKTDGISKDNNFYAWYKMTIQPGQILKIQVFEDSDKELKDCNLTIEYGKGMEGCLMNLYNRSTGTFIYPADFVDNSISILEDTELRVNFYGDDYNITQLTLNGEDVTGNLSNNSILFKMTGDMLLCIEGTPKEYATIDFTGYIINADGVMFSNTYGGEAFALPEGKHVADDIKVTSSFIMPAAETMQYSIPISEKEGKFFFRPKNGYYIANVYTLTPEGKTEQHSGSASINANIEGTTFYMVVKKLPEEYKANLNIIGEDFYLKINATQPISDNWGNPSSPSYSSETGEREISFIPEYGTPISFSFIGEEGKTPSLYLDGAAVKGVEDSESGALVFSVTPYSPSSTGETDDIQSSIVVYNSFTEHPTMSGASLELEDGAKADFFYSPVLHKADPAGQPVISGTQFTVRPESPKMVVTYKGEVVKLNENGDFVFYATGNARNNVVKVSGESEIIITDPIYTITPENGSTVDNLSAVSISFRGASSVEYNDIAILLAGPHTNLSSTDVHGSGLNWTVTFRNPNIEGEYTVTFPEGAFSIDGKPSAETKVVYNFKTGWELIPTPGSTVESLNEIVISFPAAKDVEFVGESYSFLLVNMPYFAAPGFNCEKVETAEIPTFRLTIMEGVVPPVGNYTFTIEEGAFLIDGNPSAEIFVNYIIDRDSPTDYQISPEGVIVYQDYGYGFAIIFDESTTIDHSIDSSKIKLFFDDMAVDNADYNVQPEANMLIFQITDQNYIKEGHLKLEIETGAFNLGSTPVPAISAEWEVVAPKTFDVEIITKSQPDEDGKLSDLSEIYLLFPKAKEGEVYIESGAQLRSKDYSYSQTGLISIAHTDTEGVKFIISFDPAPTIDGEYTLAVHPGTFTLDNAFESPEIEATFAFDKNSGLITLFGDEKGSVTVFTIDGKLILENVPAEQLRKLENGLYIINGKKTILK